MLSRGEHLMRGNKNVAGGGYYRRNFSSGGMNKIWLMADFRLLLFKETTCIKRILTRPERWHIMLFSQSALIPHWLCLHFFQKLKYYTLGNKDYFRKLFWVALPVNVNAKKVKGTVSPLLKAKVFINGLIWLILDY